MPNQTTIGDAAYGLLSSKFAEQFTKINPDDKRWDCSSWNGGDLSDILFKAHGADLKT